MLYFAYFYFYLIASIFPGGSDGKESTCNVGDLGLILRSRRSPAEGNGNPLQYSSWTEELRQLQSMDLQRVGHDWAAEHIHTPLNTTKFRENVTDNCRLYSAVESVWLMKLLRLPWIFFSRKNLYLYVTSEKKKKEKKWWGVVVD